MAQKRFEKLMAWRRAMAFTEAVYRLTRRFPDHEKSGLTATLRRTSAVIPARIADGHGRGNPAEFSKAIDVALGSLREIQTHLTLARRLHYASWFRLAGVVRMSRYLVRTLENLRTQVDQEATAAVAGDSKSEQRAARRRRRRRPKCDQRRAKSETAIEERQKETMVSGGLLRFLRARP